MSLELIFNRKVDYSTAVAKRPKDKRFHVSLSLGYLTSSISF
jgi:hypothetical protein